MLALISTVSLLNVQVVLSAEAIWKFTVPPLKVTFVQFPAASTFRVTPGVMLKIQLLQVRLAAGKEEVLVVAVTGITVWLVEITGISKVRAAKRVKFFIKDIFRISGLSVRVQMRCPLSN